MNAKICTNIEQSKKLIELEINVNTADMHWQCIEEDDRQLQWFVFQKDFSINQKESIPAWSLSALLKLIPNWQMQTQDNGIGILFGCKECIKIIDAGTPIDAAFEMIVWLKQNEKI